MPHFVLEWGVSVIQAVQTARSPILDQFFVGISALGSEYFYFAALPIICTMIHRAIGIRIALAILFSVMLNSFIKKFVAEPRPFLIDPSIFVIPESGYAFPSGHTQQAALFWGLAVHYYRRWWLAAVAAIFVSLVGLSRIYLGVHYPTDVLASIIIASLIIFNYHILLKQCGKLWRPSLRFWVFLFSASISVLGSVFIPSKDMISAAGLSLGLIIAILFEKELPPLLKSLRNRFLIASVTAFFLLLAFAGLKVLFPGKESPYYPLFSYIRYLSCGLLLNGVPIYFTRWMKFAP